jgi:hypothetical protein
VCTSHEFGKICYDYHYSVIQSVFTTPKILCAVRIFNFSCLSVGFWYHLSLLLLNVGVLRAYFVDLSSDYAYTLGDLISLFKCCFYVLVTFKFVSFAYTFPVIASPPFLPLLGLHL